MKDRDSQAQILQILQRLQRIRLGNFGDCKPIDEGIWELRIPYKSGFRVYYAQIGKRLVLILGGGDKRTQKRDITKAKNYLYDYQRRVS